MIADTFSRLSCQDDQSALVGKKAFTADGELACYSLLDDKEIFDCLVNLPCLISRKKRNQQTPKKRCRSNNGSINDQCYLNLPEDMEEDNPLDIENIKEKQDEDNDLQQSATRHPEWYSRKTFNNITDVLCYTKTGDDPSNSKLALPRELVRPTVNWYHQVTGHPGSKRLYEQICQRYYNRDIRRYIDNFNCDYCQRNKLDGKGNGLLPEREVRSIPFEECTVDLIGPWIVQVCGNHMNFLL